MSTLDPKVTEVLKLHQLRSRSSVAKLDTMAQRAQDGRIRHSFKYYGAHTGRWSGAGVQPQNLPRESSIWGDADIDLRGFFEAPAGHQLVVADLSGIETRVLGWLTQSQSLLNIFDQDLDPYIAFATSWFGSPYDQITKEERQAAKSAVLGCGFGLGGGELRRDCCYRVVDLERAEELGEKHCLCIERGDEYRSGLWGYSASMGAIMSHQEAHLAVKTYRQTYREVPEFWHQVEDTALEAIDTGKTVKCAGMSFGCVPKKLLWIILPSGRRLHYLRPEVQVGQKYSRPELNYSSYDVRGWRQTKLYGARLTENLVQAVSRDVLAEGLLRAHRTGLTIVGHCHDEIICEEPKGNQDALAKLIRAMTAPIEWAPGLTLKAEGYQEKVYRK